MSAHIGLGSSNQRIAVLLPTLTPPSPPLLALLAAEHGKPPRSTFSYPPKSLSTLISSTFTDHLKSYTSSHSSTQSHKLGHRLHPDETLQVRSCLVAQLRCSNVISRSNNSVR